MKSRMVLAAEILSLMIFLTAAWGQGKSAPVSGQKPEAPGPTKSAPAGTAAANDLRIVGFLLSPETVPEGRMVEAVLQIENKGNRDVAAIRIVLYLGKVLVGEGQVSRIGAGAIEKTVLSFKAGPPGLHEVAVVVDPDRRINDPARGNNQTEKILEILADSSAVLSKGIKTGAGPEKQLPTLPPPVHPTPSPAGGRAKEDHGILIQSPRGGETFTVRGGWKSAIRSWPHRRPPSSPFS